MNCLFSCRFYGFFVGAFKDLLLFDELFKKNDSFCKKF
jgi:hypothetical protein